MLCSCASCCGLFPQSCVRRTAATIKCTRHVPDASVIMRRMQQAGRTCVCQLAALQREPLQVLESCDARHAGVGQALTPCQVQALQAAHVVQHGHCCICDLQQPLGYNGNSGTCDQMPMCHAAAVPQQCQSACLQRSQKSHQSTTGACMRLTACTGLK